MPQSTWTVENESGLLVRQKINAVIQALVTNSSGSTEPGVTLAHMWWVDTSGANAILKVRNAANDGWVTIGPLNAEAFGLKGSTVGNGAPATPFAGQFWIDTTVALAPLLKMRNAGNSAWVTLGRADLANLGHLPLTGGSMSGGITFTNTDATMVPAGTTAQRPAAPVNGHIRYNSDLQQFEGYRNGAWGAIGGGAIKENAAQTNLVDGGTIAISTLDPRQGGVVSADVGTSATLSLTPFGNISGLMGVTEVSLYNPNPDRPVFLTKNDANDGCVGNFDVIEIAPDLSVKCTIFPTTRRIVVSRGM